MRKKHKQKPQMNEGLCPENFEICVPRGCRLLGYRWDREYEVPQHPEARANDIKDWNAYLQALTPDHELTSEYEDPNYPPPLCWTCDCKPGWLLKGELAVAHACRVHDRIHRQLLGFEQVSAVDVGFALWERQTRFGDFLAIRIHVNQKLPPEQLVRAGLISFTQAQSAFSVDDLRKGVGPQSTGQSECCTDPGSDCPHPDRRWRILEILQQEFQGKQRFLEGLNRYPISGIRKEDLSIFCPPNPEESIYKDSAFERPHKHYSEVEPQSMDDIRLCICGVPLDIINAQYTPSIFHPGGDAPEGVFVKPSQPGDQLKNDELLLIGRGRTNPLVGGISIGSVTGQAGTLGAVVWDRTDGTPCILGNWHVLAGNATAQIDQPTYQPALFDGGTEDDVIARLKRWHLGEEGDAAIAELTGDRYYASGEILGLWHPVSGTLPPRLNLEVRKWGRSTGFTKGFIDGIHLATNIDYGSGSVRYFENQFHIAPLHAGTDVSQVGDSGSLVVTRFRPADMQDDLSKLCQWLRDACDSEQSLCDDIEDDLESLIKTCEEAEAKYCGKICEFFKSLDPCNPWSSPPDCKTSPPYDPIKYPQIDDTIASLRHYIANAQCALDNICEDIRESFALYICLEYGLKELFEKCQEREIRPSKIQKYLERLIKRCMPETQEQSVDKIPKGKRELIEEIQYLGLGSPPRWDCDDIEEALEEIEETRKHLEECLQLCRHADQVFEHWLKRCKRIRRGKKLCEILHPSPNPMSHPQACDDESETTCAGKKPECEDAAALVECIKEKLDDDLVVCSPVYESSEIMPLLKTLLYKETQDPGFFLKEIKGSARRYYQRKKAKLDRKTNRAYYAVGMIFAGDTPGSPFGEFAVASDIERLSQELRFSLRPVFEPRSSFRELRVRPPGPGRRDAAIRSRRSRMPGAQGADPRPGGPQPDPERSQSDPDQ